MCCFPCVDLRISFIILMVLLLFYKDCFTGSNGCRLLLGVNSTIIAVVSENDPFWVKED